MQKGLVTAIAQPLSPRPELGEDRSARKKSSSFRVFLAFGFLIIESYPAQHKGARRSAHLAVLNQGRNKDKCAKSFAVVSRDMDRCAASTRRGSNGPWFNSRPCQTVISPSWFASRCSRSTRRQFIQVQKKKKTNKKAAAPKKTYCAAAAVPAEKYWFSTEVATDWYF